VISSPFSPECRVAREKLWRGSGNNFNRFTVLWKNEARRATVSLLQPGKSSGEMEQDITSRSGEYIASDPLSHRRKSMIDDWNQYHRKSAARIRRPVKVSPEHDSRLTKTRVRQFKTSKLGEKTRQLISLAVAVTTHCDGCIVAVHTDAGSQKPERPKKEIAGLSECRCMNRGSSSVYSSRVLMPWSQNFQRRPSPVICTSSWTAYSE